MTDDEPEVFVAPSTTMPPAIVLERRMVSVLWSSSRSHHLRPASSPRRRPANAASRNAGYRSGSRNRTKARRSAISEARSHACSVHTMLRRALEDAVRSSLIPPEPRLPNADRESSGRNKHGFAPPRWRTSWPLSDFVSQICIRHFDWPHWRAFDVESSRVSDGATSTMTRAH